MSFLLTLEEDKLMEIIELLPRYEAKINAAEPIFELEGRKLEEIMRTLPHYQSSYDQSLNELKGLVEWLENMKAKKVGRLWKKYTEGYSRALTAKDVQAYIGNEKEIIEINQIIIEVVMLRNNLESIVEALGQMGWMVGHITKLRISEMQDAIL